MHWIYHLLRKRLLQAAIGREQSIQHRVFAMMPMGSIALALVTGFLAMRFLERSVTDTMFIGAISIGVGGSVAYVAVTFALAGHQRAMVEVFYDHALKAGLVTYLGRDEATGRKMLRKSISMSMGVQQGAAAATVVTAMSLGLIAAALGALVGGSVRTGILVSYVTWTWLTLRNLRASADFIALTPFMWDLYAWLEERHDPTLCKICTKAASVAGRNALVHEVPQTTEGDGRS